MKQSRHSLMAKGIIVLLSLLVLIFALTYSWFTDVRTQVDATGIQAGVSASASYDYAIGFYNSQTLDQYVVTAFSDQARDLSTLTVPGREGTFNVFADFRATDVTGSGSTLIRPAMQGKNKDIDTTSDTYTIASPNTQYINFDIIFRSKTNHAPYRLGEASYVIASCENTAADGSLITQRNTNKSTYGEFNRDAIVGALRVAFTDYNIDSHTGSDPVNGLNISNYTTNTTEYLKTKQGNTYLPPNILWLPRPDLYMRAVPNLTTGFSLYTDISSSNPLGYKQGDPNETRDSDVTATSGSGGLWALTSVHKYYDIYETETRNHFTTNSNTVTTPDGNTDVISSNTINATPDASGWYYTKVNCRIWIEGCDTEARRALSGGKFRIYFAFC